MAKTNSKAVSFRLREEAMWALVELAERWDISQTRAVEKAIMQAHGGGGEVVNRETGEVYGDPRAIPGVVVGVKNLPKREVELPDFSKVSVETAGIPCVCRHSGCRGSKFMGTRRFQSLCPECVEQGHSGDARNCVECFNDTGPA